MRYLIFMVSIVDISTACQTTLIATQVINNATYDISEDTKVFATLAWNTSISNCPITYTILDNSTLAPFRVDYFQIVNNSVISSYIITGFDVGYYAIRVKGAVGTYVEDYVVFTVNVTNICPSTTIYPSTLDNQTYIIGSP